MQISVFGMGYVGAVTAACLADMGHEVIGVDVNRDKVGMINAGQAPVIEPGLPERIATAVSTGRLRATMDPEEAVCNSQMSLICVGTPTTETDGVALDALQNVVDQIGTALRHKTAVHAIVIRSTIPPGTTEERVVPILEMASGRRIGKELELCFNPEFLREGSALHDFHHPPFTLIGAKDVDSPLLIEEIYHSMPAPIFRTGFGVAEAVKYVSNAFHALKITFANEVGSVLRSQGMDGREVMRLFCEDHQLNISAAYLRPGFAFGGSCLPKDSRALIHLARTQKVRTPLLEQLIVSNDTHIERAFQLITAHGRRRVCLFGLAFKPNTDDLRNSPFVVLAERLIGRGYPVRIFDRCVELSRLMGNNNEFIRHEIPHLETLMAASPEDAMDGMEVIVVGHAGPDEVAAILAGHRGRQIVDLQGVDALQALGPDRYQGICW
ncbi:GDP-mannose 6-dehydrogenase (plasmid) [Rhodovastum atsumiense]|uniref:UDP-glucose 6-dehydrogenase n=1 Tax=Rhodovastum atsumiense TaxID=504468 RepID=A0A5M6IKM1_9PROT|nr:nucleotide sugar dehydrogenase [Rhodovastum atsumiense]KAA5608429.1 UDP-glucose/GDP-mannose dehydrogenase family protein [Rhodovastum atsumiense]CAH2605712.1 GDP-mannose 6-dehydrogenase [Rhodovastum atsumiense]